MDAKVTLIELKKMRDGVITPRQTTEMVEALINITQRLSGIEEEDLTKAEKQILTDLEEVIK